MGPLKKIWFSVTSFRRIHFSLNSFVSIAVIAAIIYIVFLKDLAIAGNNLIAAWYSPESVWHPFLMGVLASVVAAFIFALAGVFVFGWINKFRLIGNYDAFAIDDNGNREPWGTVKISYHPMSTSTHHVPVKLTLTYEDVVLEGDGLIIDNRYIAGHYAED